MGKSSSKSKLLIIGLILISIGGLLLASNLGFLDWNAKEYIVSWKTLLIVVGLVSMAKREGIAVGIILILVGSFFHLREFVEMPFNFHQVFWPALLILVGLAFLFNRILFKPKLYSSDGVEISPESDEEVIDDVAVFGGVERTITAQKFRGGKSVSLFGGSKLNLMNTRLAEGTHFLEVIAIFGGSQYIVPKDWNIKINVVTIFGGFADKRPVTTDDIDTSKQLIIKGVAIFGGGEIKSY